MKETRDLCQYDSRWELIDSVPERKFFESNSLLYLEQKLPGYKLLMDRNYSLYIRKYISLPNDCRANI